MTRISVDDSELRDFATHLQGVDSRLTRHLRPVLEKGAVNIKNDLTERMRQSRHFKGTAPGISYDIEVTDSGYEAEIGPVKGRPGSLANIAYFGTSRGGGTVEDPVEALNRETSAFEENLLEVAAGLVIE